MKESTTPQRSPKSLTYDRQASSNGGSGPWRDADQAVRTFVAERPFAAVGLALTAGYLIGRAVNAARCSRTRR